MHRNERPNQSLFNLHTVSLREEMAIVVFQHDTSGCRCHETSGAPTFLVSVATVAFQLGVLCKRPRVHETTYGLLNRFGNQPSVSMTGCTRGAIDPVSMITYVECACGLGSQKGGTYKFVFIFIYGSNIDDVPAPKKPIISKRVVSASSIASS